jgi:hypothetical protein
LGGGGGTFRGRRFHRYFLTARRAVLLLLQPLLKAAEMENVAAGNSFDAFAGRGVHVLPANNTSPAAGTEGLHLLLGHVWEPVVQGGREAAVVDIGCDATLEILQRHPELPEDVQRHA